MIVNVVDREVVITSYKEQERWTIDLMAEEQLHRGCSAELSESKGC